MASEVIDRARASYRERAWAAAYADFHAADDESPLAIDDLEQLALTAYLIGKDDDSLEIPCRVHGRSRPRWTTTSLPATGRHSRFMNSPASSPPSNLRHLSWRSCSARCVAIRTR